MRTRWTEEKLALLRKLKAQKMSYKDISARMGISVDSARLASQTHKIPVNDPFWTKERLEEARDLYLVQGKSLSQLAVYYGVSRGAMSGVRYRAKWPIKPPQPRLNAKPRRAAPNKPKPKREVSAEALAGVYRIYRGETVADAPTKPLSDAFAVSLTARPWITRKAGECAWPVGTPDRPAEQLSCCAPARGTYCDEHEAARHGKVAPSLTNRALGLVRKPKAKPQPCFADYERECA